MFSSGRPRTDCCDSKHFEYFPFFILSPLEILKKVDAEIDRKPVRDLEEEGTSDVKLKHKIDEKKNDRIRFCREIDLILGITTRSIQIS